MRNTSKTRRDRPLDRFLKLIGRVPWLWWLAALLYGLLVVLILGPRPIDPVLGAGDTDLWEYTGFYVQQYWRWWPLPHLQLDPEGMIYPYGGLVALQAWGLERDLFYGALASLWGPGPWLKIYFLLSVAIALVGVTRILRPDFGDRRALLVAIGAVLLNPYAIVCKFPVHSNMAITHWTVLGLTMDFVLVWRWTRGRPIERRWWLGRAALVGLSLGQDLGYVAGFGLLSLVLSWGWMGAIGLGQWVQNRWVQNNRLDTRYQIQRAGDRPPTVWQRMAQDWRRPLEPIEWAGVGAIGWAGWMYFLPVLPIVRAAKAFDWSGTFDRAWFSHPLRLLAPYWPGINPIEAAGWWRSILPAPLETDFDGVVGWGLLLAGAIGLWRGRRHWAAFVPLGLLLLLVLAYRPWDVPTLQVFPWFAFNRVAGRSTVVLPVVFALFGLGWGMDGGQSRLEQSRLEQSRLNRWAIGLVAIAALLDLTGGYGLKLRQPAISVDRDFWAYMATVRDQPEPAVLDWPFCVTGGNGVGSGDGTCPFFVHNPSTHALRRFHHKATIGQYLGRLHPSQVQPLIRAGWPALALPDDPDLNRTQRQRRCFWDDEWDFFQRFFQLGDFAGINLYVDRLAIGCEAAFYDRFGPPIAQTQIPGIGRVVFLPKPAAWRSLVDPERARSLQFAPPLDGREPDLVQFGSVRGVTILAGLDRPRHGQRWGLAPATVLELRADRPRTATLQIRATVPIAQQTLAIALNDQPLWQSGPLVAGQTLAIDLPLQLPAGPSRLTLTYGRSTRLHDRLPAAGNRPIALTFDRLAIDIPAPPRRDESAPEPAR